MWQTWRVSGCDVGLESRYSQALEELYTRRAMKMGLSRAGDWLRRLGNPDREYEVIHVAGTNGKGSTAWKVAAALRTTGSRVGLFTSPHISSFRERIRVDGHHIPKCHVVDFLDHVKAAEAESRRLAAVDSEADRLTFFEICTVLALSYFAAEKCTFAVVETGLGGRLDATAAIERPSQCVITSIGWDHMSILGDSLDAIAAEKAGILRAGVPVVLGPTAARCPVLSEAKRLGAPIHFTDVCGSRSLSPDAENTAIARKCIRVLGTPGVDEDAFATRAPLRFEILEGERLEAAARAVCQPGRGGESTLPPLPLAAVIDVAHNATAVRRLLAES
eukprot:Polyplicarium_translucidae@DN1849_c0_g1_i1.p1